MLHKVGVSLVAFRKTVFGMMISWLDFMEDDSAKLNHMSLGWRYGMRLLESFLPEKKILLRAVPGALAMIALLMYPSFTSAQEDNLARDLANPFSSVWSITNQINFNQLKGGLLRDTQTQFNWNFQPVMPVPFNGCYNLVNRMVVPFYNTPYVDLNLDVQFVPGIGRVQIGGVGL
ncbi:MAG TPA: hypothetical protein VMC85_08610, partial [Desulfomonilaceae bacterium]|nr:hypothetical protein [Desulfomonilaceae bacterium]